MIGGHDIVIPASGSAAMLEACARIIKRYWPQVRFENALTGDKYQDFSGIPFSRVRELLAYPSADAEAAWDADSTDSAENSMLNLILSPDSVTVVLDNPDTAEMQAILNSFRQFLWLNYAVAA